MATIVGKLAIVTVILFLSFVMLFIPTFLIKENFAVSPSKIILSSQSDQGILTPAAITSIYNTLNLNDATNDLEDSTAPMRLKACFQIDKVLRSSGSLAENLPVDTHAYTIPFDGMFSSVTQIHTRIIQEVTNFKEALGVPIEGKAYVLLTQVPYFKNERGNPVSAGYYLNERYDYWPADGRADVYSFGAIVFANYDMQKNKLETSLFEQSVLPTLFTKATNDKQCFLRCLQSDHMCGCASSDPGIYKDDPSYTAKCMGRGNPTDLQKSGSEQLEVSTFYTFFEINRTNKSYSGMFHIV
jgi:hypothetical protein